MDGKIHAQFGWLDYLIFALMLGISSVIGVYFGSIGKKGDSIREYLHGGKTMGTIPVAASHISSMISGIMILGLPSEIYMHGTLFWLACVSAIIVCLINSYLYLPVFYDLQLTSVYEYLELRFNKRVRVLTSTLSTLSLLLYMPFVIYAPALALGHVSGLHLHYNIPLITIVCILYTMVKISKPDQMVACYVTSISNFVPGLAGLFVAGVVSAALSTLSSHLNSIGATIFEDFICPLLKREISEKSTNDAMKLVIIVFGVVCIALVFVVEKLGLVLQLTSSFLGVTGGTVLAMFTLGMFYPKANSKGVLAGSIVSLFLTGWLVLGAQIAMTEGRLKYPTLHTTAEGCGYPDSPVSSENDDDVFILYKISFTYYSTIGFLLVLIVGIPVSAITARINGGGQQEQPNLFTPVIKRNFIKNSENYSICRTTDIEEFHTKC